MKKIYIIPGIKTREVSTYGLLLSSKGENTGFVNSSTSSMSDEMSSTVGDGDGMAADSKKNSFGEWDDDEVVEK